LSGLRFSTELDLPSWNPRKDSYARMTSALALMEAILNVREQMLKTHLRESLSIAIWKYTERDGKYTTRFRSRGAIEAPKGKLNHEHVITRKALVDDLLSKPEDFQSIMTKAVACTVLTREHSLLRAVEKENGGLIGSDRYRAAGIEVFDLSTRQRLI
jgi:hypothetical protein